MGELTAYGEFVLAHAALSRAAFLGRVQVAHLFFHDVSKLLETAEFTTMRSREADTPVALASRSRWPEELGRAAVCPIVKSSGNVIGPRVSIGRSRLCDVLLADPRISKSHAYLCQEGSRWTLTDSGSTNGTTVDGLELPPHQAMPLVSGARIRFSGTIEALFLEPESLYDLVADVAASLAGATD